MSTPLKSYPCRDVAAAICREFALTRALPGHRVVRVGTRVLVYARPATANERTAK